MAINCSSDDKQKQYLTVKYLLEAPGFHFLKLIFIVKYSGVEMNAVNGAGDSILDLAKRTRSDLLELLKSHMK